MSDKGELSPNAASSTAGKPKKSALVSQGLMTMVPGGGSGGAGRLMRLYSSVWAVPQGRRSMVRVSTCSNPCFRKRLRLIGEASTKAER